MRIYTTFLLAGLCLLSGIVVRAQRQNNVWCFGIHAGIDFNSGTPSFFETNMEVGEGCASVSDPSGQLLFYTSGAKVWDRNGNVMPNGSGLAGSTYSSRRGAVIVQSVGNPSQYYVITTDEIESGLHNAYYSVVDMSLNGGLGDVVPSQSSILIASELAEGVVVTSMPGCTGFWVILHRMFASEYLAYRIDATGIAAAPVVSTGLPTSSFMGAYQGIVGFNNAGTRILRLDSGWQETAAFDKSTGVFSGFQQLNLPSISSFLIFSPDDQKLYYTGAQSQAPYVALYQVDISLLPNAAAVQSSAVKVANTQSFDMRRGPDNKLYFLVSYGSYMGCINNPNATGVACNADPTYMAWPSYVTSGGPTIVFFEMGQNAATLQFDTAASYKDTIFCAGSHAILTAPAGYQSYLWSTGDTSSSLAVAQDGMFWVGGMKDCHWHIDSFHVTFEHISANLGPDTFICEGQTKVLDVTAPGAAYQWQDGSTDATYTASRAGTYHVKITRNGCTAADTIVLEEVTPRLSILEPDTMLCLGTQITLHALATPASQLLWSNASTEDHILTNGPGKYKVTATSVCGILSDEVNIEEATCNCERPFVPNAFSPNNDNKNESFRVYINCPGINGFYFAIYNRFGQRIFESRNIDQGWDGLHNGQKADLGVYFYRLVCKTPEGKEIKKKGDITLLR